ncbi:YheC/YheD family protein [Ammoniphilus sp. YIM 78166]|uniref:YheC/YheD family protein n=1 Tax=Ammoniphilus sp. YIM 78166 TaxID=1644106 RepID=UPI0014302963|nr:YheC/YheD family protein [Ammoniphilus sp. YIM 78166]
MLKHIIMRNKWRIARVLLDDPYLSQYVPDTVWFSSKGLIKKLKRHKHIYIKPNDGLKGEGIIRVKSLSDQKYEVSYGKKVKKLNFPDMIDRVREQISGKGDFLIQKGIELATYDKRPFDIRLLLVKDLGRWHLTMITAKVAAYKNAIVTNVSYNKKLRSTDDLEFPISKVLYESDQRFNPFATFRELMDVSYQIANTLGRQFPFGILGLDLAVDKKGNIWFIEANTSPAIKPMRKTNDRKWYRIVREAQKNIEIIEP